MFDGVIIKAAGLGSRLKPLTDYVPKPFVNYNGMPLISHQFELIDRYHIEKVVISTKENFLPFMPSLPRKSLIVFNEANVNGGFIEYFKNYSIQGIWLVLCADVVTLVV